MKPKIIHVITRLDMGGSALETMLVCNALAKKYDLLLLHGLSLESQMEHMEKKNVLHMIDSAKEKGVRVIPLPSLKRKIAPFYDIWAFISILKILIREKPAIVHTHTSKAGIIGRMAAKIAGVPAIIHKPHGHVFFGHFGWLTSKLFLLIEKMFDHMTDCVVALTEGEKQDYVKLRVYRKDKIVKIHSGVDVELFMRSGSDVDKKRISLGLNPGDMVVGTVGWLLAIKGPAYLLKAMGVVWKKFPDARLVYVGKGDLEEKLKAEVLRMGAFDRVRFLGWREDVAEIMPTFDVFVLPSLNEGMGRVIVEAMAAAKPVVASRAGGIPDLVTDGQNGLLVSPADPQALAGAIQTLLESPELRREMGAKGRQMSTDFSVAKMIEKLDNLYLRYL